MTHIPYIGSGPYCYANSFAMMFGDRRAVHRGDRVRHRRRFGMQLVGGTLPFFDPYGWTPEAGFDDALAALGWTSSVRRGGTAEQALAALAAALADGPGLGRPGGDGPSAPPARHDRADRRRPQCRRPRPGRGTVLMHDPQGHPYATLPVEDFIGRLAGRDRSTTPRPTRCAPRSGSCGTVTEEAAIEAALPAARRWLSMAEGRHLPPPVPSATPRRRSAWRRGSRPAAITGCATIWSISPCRVGARRVADAATCLARIGRGEAARIMDWPSPADRRAAAPAGGRRRRRPRRAAARPGAQLWRAAGGAAGGLTPRPPPVPRSAHARTRCPPLRPRPPRSCPPSPRYRRRRAGRRGGADAGQRHRSLRPADHPRGAYPHRTLPFVPGFEGGPGPCARHGRGAGARRDRLRLASGCCRSARLAAGKAGKGMPAGGACRCRRI